MSQQVSVEKLSTIVGNGFANLTPSMKKANEDERRRKFAAYIQDCMNENGQRNPREVQDQSRKYGEGISDALISKFLNRERGDCNVASIVGLADGLMRPPDEVFMAWLGKVAPISTREYRESDFAHLWQLVKSAPTQEKKVYFRYVKMLVADVQRVIGLTQPE